MWLSVTVSRTNDSLSPGCERELAEDAFIADAEADSRGERERQRGVLKTTPCSCTTVSCSSRP